MSTNPSTAKSAFVSYTGADESSAKAIAAALQADGVATFFAPWSISPGDSLPGRVFDDGLKRADVVVFLLSAKSAASEWVKAERDVATVLRIEQGTRIVTVRLDDTPVPVALKALKWLNGRTADERSAAVRDIVNAVYGCTDQPPLGSVPQRIRQMSARSSSLSALAATLGRAMLSACDDASGKTPMFTGPDLAEHLRWTATEVDEAVAELEHFRMAQVWRAIGTAPFEFHRVAPLPPLHEEFAKELGYDPAADARAVAATVASIGAGEFADSARLARETGLSPGRLNRAVDHLEIVGVVRVYRAIGTGPFTFRMAQALPGTRLWVRGNPPA